MFYVLYTCRLYPKICKLMLWIALFYVAIMFNLIMNVRPFCAKFKCNLYIYIYMVYLLYRVFI